MANKNITHICGSLPLVFDHPVAGHEPIDIPVRIEIEPQGLFPRATLMVNDPELISILIDAITSTRSELRIVAGFEITGAGAFNGF